jgi:hypothetical protein
MKRFITLLLIASLSVSLFAQDNPQAKDSYTEETTLKAPVVPEIEKNNTSSAIKEILKKEEINDKWGFIGEQFYDKLASYGNTENIFKNYSTFGFFFFLILVGGIGFSENNFGVTLFGVLGFIGSCILGFNEENKTKEISYKYTLKPFLQNWKKYKESTPKELHGLFDALYEEYQKNTKSFFDNHDDVVKIVQKIFTQLYKNNAQYAEKESRAYQEKHKKTEHLVVSTPIILRN